MSSVALNLRFPNAKENVALDRWSRLDIHLFELGPVLLPMIRDHYKNTIPIHPWLVLVGLVSLFFDIIRVMASGFMAQM